MPSCKYFFGKVFAHLAGALAISAASAEYSTLNENLLGGTSVLIRTLLSLGILIGLLFGTQLTRPGGFAKYGFFYCLCLLDGSDLEALY